MQIKVASKVHNRIKQFYYNAMLKYPNTYFPDDADRDIYKVTNELMKVGTRLWKKNNNILLKWENYFVDYSKVTGWYFAYRIEENTIYIEDVENYRNMSNFANIKVDKDE